MRLLDLFAGIGGFSLAAHWIGWETVAFVEKDKFCQKVLRKNFGHDIEIHDDITTFSGKPFRGRVDLITGGFPCQPFSAAGKQRGEDDERHLFPEMLRVVEEVGPRWVVAENVRGLLGVGNGETFEWMCGALEGLGYAVQAFCIPAGAVGAPHLRERLWMVANSDGDGLETHTGVQLLRKQTNSIVCNGSLSRLSVWNGSAPRRTSFCGVRDGLPDRLDRIKALGNAVVPQIAFEIFRAIEAAEKK